MARAAVVPPIVRLRIAAIVGAVLLALLLPLFWWPLRLAGPLSLLLLLLAVYSLWCLWPRWQLGIAASLRGALPCPPGQPLRLTFDDGPTAELTPQLLDLLQQNRICASFFVLLGKARAQPALIRRIIADGHLLGLHGADHHRPFGRSAAALTQSLQKAKQELEAIAGQPVTLYRPSYGNKTLALLRAVRQAGLKLSFWDYGVWDTDAPPPSLLHRRLLAVATAATTAQKPPILLLHDGRGDDQAPSAHAQVLLTTLATWLPTLRR
jgi:peptidoglycan/xylan/chitin deacetylase (PgdA/CDA1 family)